MNITEPKTTSPITTPSSSSLARRTTTGRRFDGICFGVAANLNVAGKGFSGFPILDGVVGGVRDGNGFDDLVAVGPFTSGGVFSGEEKTHCDGGDDNEGDDEGYTPCDVFSETLVLDERIEDSGHNEISDSTT